MKVPGYFLFSALLLALSQPVSGATDKLRVTGDRVNLRSRPDIGSEVVGQVSSNDVLFGRGDYTSRWVEVRCPEAVSLWVYKELVAGNEISASRLRVRCGPGISFRSVGEVAENTKVEIRGEREDWLEIAPPSSCSLWISSKYVEPFTAKPEARTRGRSSVDHDQAALDAQQRDAAGRNSTARCSSEKKQQGDVSTRRQAASRGTRHQSFRSDSDARTLSSRAKSRDVDPGSVPSERGRSSRQAVKDVTVIVPDELQSRQLVDSREQGGLVEHKGVLRPVGFMWLRPGEFRLVRRDASGKAITVCYVLGDRSVLESKEGHTLILYGRQYWVQGIRRPVVDASQLVIRD